MKLLAELYRSHYGEAPATIEKIATGGGSNRQYYRLRAIDGGSVVGVVGTSVEENHAFIYLAKHFFGKGLSVPEVYAESADGLRYLQQDLGERSLYQALQHGREALGNYSNEEIALIKRTIRYLPALQFRGNDGLDYSQCYSIKEFNTQSVMFDLNYFKYCFLKATAIEFNEVSLENDFHALADSLTKAALTAFMYRDFQARNVMLSKDDTPYFIDFQGGRLGPAYYDLASFLWQASARYSESLRNELIDEYFEALNEYVVPPEKGVFVARLQEFVLFRILQVLGAYGFRGYFERKPYFIRSIAPALQNLQYLLQKRAFPYPYLTEILNKLAVLPQYAPSMTTSETPQRLVVSIVSFSYKYGIPTDESGHGGGYVFDCRGTNNPGRYPEFHEMTGLDEPVKKFIEEDGSLLRFLNNVYALADAHVECYIERGFTNLMFAFGCTGGRHRSIYAAEHLAEHLHEKYGVEVHISHREQDINKVLR